jgi:DNA polymerase-3 subunit gamma/tau
VEQPAEPAPTGGLTVVDVRRLWPDVVQALSGLRRATWALLSSHAQVVGLQGEVLTIGFTTPGLREQYASGGHEPHLRQALVNVVGAEWRIEAIVDPGVRPGGPPAAGSPQRPAPEQPSPPAGPTAPEPFAEDRPPQEPPPWDLPPDDSAEPGLPQAQAAESRLDGRAIDAARGAIQPTRTGGRAVDTAAEDLRAADAHAHPDDLDADADNLGGAALLERELGAQIIEEIRHQ